MAHIGDTELTKSLDKKEKFTKVYQLGWEALAALIANPSGRLYVFIANNCGHNNGLVCTIDVIAEELGVCKRTIDRASAKLQKEGHLEVFKVGTANLYVLNKHQVWKTYEDHKNFAALDARTLMGRKQNAHIKKRLTHMLSQQPKNEAQ
jgi:serine/threonine protein phosphatase PrpC